MRGFNKMNNLKYRPNVMNKWVSECRNYLGKFSNVISNESIEEVITNHMHEIHDYAFTNTKYSLCNRAREVNGKLKITKELIREILVELETEASLGNGLDYLGIEPDEVIDWTVEKMYPYFKENFKGEYYKK